MTTVLKASGSAEFLGIVPALAGFTPARSVVLLPFHGKRTYGAMRLDLPADHTDLEEYADVAIGLVSRVSATDAVAVVIYTDESPMPTRDGLVLPFTVAVEELVGCAEDAGLRIVDALCVTPDGWSCYLDDEPQLGSLDEVPSTPAVPGIGDVRGDHLAGTDLPRADLIRKEQVGAALRDISAALDHCGPLTGRENPEALTAITMLDDMPEFFESLLEHPQTIPPFAIAALLWCLERPIFRDVALTQWAAGLDAGTRTLAAQVEFSRNPASFPDELGRVFLGLGPAPDADRLDLALSVVRHAAAAAPRASRPGPLTAAAWLSWALGRSSHAGYYLGLVNEIDPSYGLALLLNTMIDAAVLPEWTFQRGPTA